MLSLDLSTSECRGRVVVALRGELDVADAATVGAALAAVAAREREIIVDLAGLGFIDCSGVAALVRARKHARDGGGDLLLAAATQQVLRVLTLTRLIDVFSVHASVEEAAQGPQRQRFVVGAVHYQQDASTRQPIPLGAERGQVPAGPLTAAGQAAKESLHPEAAAGPR